MLTYSVTTVSQGPGGVQLSPQQLCEWPFDLFVQQTLQWRFKGLIHPEALLHEEEVGQSGTLMRKSL